MYWRLKRGNAGNTDFVSWYHGNLWHIVSILLFYFAILYMIPAHREKKYWERGKAGNHSSYVSWLFWERRFEPTSTAAEISTNLVLWGKDTLHVGVGWGKGGGGRPSVCPDKQGIWKFLFCSLFPSRFGQMSVLSFKDKLSLFCCSVCVMPKINSSHKFASHS